MKNFMLSWGLVFLSALCDSYAATIVKIKFNELGHIDFSSLAGFMRYLFAFFKSPILLTAIITFLAAPVLWFIALNRLDLSVGYPVIVGLHLIFISFFAVFLIGETITVNKMIGMGLALLSIYFIYK